LDPERQKDNKTLGTATGVKYETKQVELGGRKKSRGEVQGMNKKTWKGPSKHPGGDAAEKKRDDDIEEESRASKGQWKKRWW